MLLKNLEVGQYFKLANGITYQVQCNDWWENGFLRDFICIDAQGNKKHFSFLDSETAFIGAELVSGFHNSLAISKITVFENGTAQLHFKDREPLIISTIEYARP